MSSRITNTRLIAVAIGIMLVLLVALLASIVGGIAIRGTGSLQQPVEIEVSDPALRGVPVVVRVRPAQPGVVELLWRSLGREVVIGQAEAGALSRVVFPCTGAAVGTLLGRELPSGKVVASRSLVLLSPTADCLGSAVP